MKRAMLQLAGFSLLAFTFNSSAAVFYVDANGTSPTPPYTNWSTAALNIQDAVDAAGDGDTVLVTNGVYQTGGRVTDMTNRLVITKPITVQSINGPAVTVIRGYQAPGTITGPGAVRGVFLGNGPTLSGFTVTGGGANGGGGIYCATTDEIVTNCVISGNNSAAAGGGVYYGTLYQCVVSQNVAVGDGGGSYHSHLYNCLVTTNSANNGGGTSLGYLNNCVVAGNSAQTSGGGTFIAGSIRSCTIVGNRAGSIGGGAYGMSAIYQNCIICYNTARTGGPFTNVYDPGLDMRNCCVTPRIPGALNNITNPPAFEDLAGGNYRLRIGSPCIDAGTNLNVNWSMDLDGNPRIVGQAIDIGAYENQNTGAVHYVSLSSTNPVPPYTNWATAATNIQAAVAVALDGEMVLAGDGTYAVGGVTVYGSEANRVALTNGITLASLNGLKTTRIMGESQTRCVYVGSNATLSGFTLINGQTRSSGDLLREQSGGGVWCESSNAVVSDCLITNNIAWQNGGGAFGGTLYRCTLAGNMVYNFGGGAYSNTAWNCILINNSATYAGGGAASANLFNCLIASNNYSSGGYANGAGAYQGTLSNCTLTANGKIYGTTGGGAYRSLLLNCRLLTNYSSYGPGGAQYSELHGCILMGNQGSTSGGTYQCTNYNCILQGNVGSGIYGGISYNCLVIGNIAAYQGGGASLGTLYNCTVVGNMATNPGAGGGGVYSSTLYNCIVYSNTAYANPNWAGSTLAYFTCTTPKPSGTGNITNAPWFIDPANNDFRLACGSPGINAGNNSFALTATDLNGNPRIADGTVDLGACEFNPAADLVPELHKQFDFDNFAAAYPVSFTGRIAGCPDFFWWDFGDGTTVTNQAAVSHAWASPGNYDIVLTAYSAGLGYGLSATTRVSVVQQPVYYVNASSPGPVAPYNSWSTAARSIQDGVSAGNTLGRLVLVTNGLYYSQVGGAIQWKNVILTNLVMVQSINGPGATIIQGSYPYRVAYVGNYSRLNGFTVTGGYAGSSGDLYTDQSGGGVWCEPVGVVSNCIVTGNSASYGGGGAYQGIFYDCVFSNNSVNANADYSGGGGAYAGIFYHCSFVSNTVYGQNANYRSGGGGAAMSTLFDSCIASNQSLVIGRGGGALSCVLSNCTVAYNTADYHGGGAADSTLYHCIVRGNSTTSSGGGGGASCTFWNCVLIENRAGSSGGGAGWSLLHNCLVVSNQAVNYGGGLFGGTNYNCTIVQNTARIAGGFYGYDNPSQIYNGIVFANNALTGSNWAGNVFSRNSCSVPQLGPLGATYGNLANDPAFVDAAFHLSATSPCRGAGSSPYTGGTDLDGEAWNNPPAMGMDEVFDADFIGALSVAIQSPQTSLLVNRSLPLTGQVTGRAARLEWSFDDGPALTTASYFTSHAWTVPGDYNVSFTAYNTDNPGGVSTSLPVHVLPLDPPALQSAAFSLTSANGFQFQFNGQSNAIYTVQVATNLVPPVTWRNLQTITSTGGVVQVMDVNARSNVASFYRVGVQ